MITYIESHNQQVCLSYYSLALSLRLYG